MKDAEDMGPGYDQSLEVAKEKYRHEPGENGKGGVTTCWLYNGENIVIAVGSAICSKVDTYSKKRGRVISKGRALKVLRTGKQIETRAGTLTFISGMVG